MRILIAAIGKMRAGPERELAERYLERSLAAGKQVGLSPVDIREFAESRAGNPETRAREEAEALLGALPERAKFILLDERGKSMPSAVFARSLATYRDGGAETLGFIIGGPDGLDPGLRDRAQLVLGFSAMTWPHQLTRVMLLEQIYRAITILSGHPYHRDG
jgi:23S rRNA (pseudouridine1915-N3)-methyltransferase